VQTCALPIWRVSLPREPQPLQERFPAARGLLRALHRLHAGALSGRPPEGSGPGLRARRGGGLPEGQLAGRGRGTPATSVARGTDGRAMSFFGDGALPLGMVFFAGLVFGVLRRKSGHRAAARGYPDLATRLGLTYKPSSYRSGVGSLVGTYQGFVVIVDPDEQRRIRVRFEGAPAVDL